jgi:hypothetical protein
MKLQTLEPSVMTLQWNTVAPSSMVTRERLTSEGQTCLYVSPFPNESERDSSSRYVSDRDGLEGRELLEKCIKWHLRKGKWTAGVTELRRAPGCVWRSGVGRRSEGTLAVGIGRQQDLKNFK